MTDRPILMSPSMVRALLKEAAEADTGKSMTRRLAWSFHDVGDNHTKEPTAWQKVKPGDRLWVRETWRAPVQFDRMPPRDIPPGTVIQYEATGPEFDEGLSGKTRVNLHMPKWASRLTLVVTATKVEPLHAISEQDCEREGCWWTGPLPGHWSVRLPSGKLFTAEGNQPERCFRALWEALHGVDAWAANPEVVALTFRVHEQNIDQISMVA